VRAWYLTDSYQISSSNIALQGRNRVWNPNHGIIFGNNALSVTPNSPRLSSMISSTTNDADLANHSSFEDSYVLASSFDPEIPDSQVSTTSLTSSSKDTDDGSWAPSTAAASQESEVQDTFIEEEFFEVSSKDLNHPNQEIVAKEIHVPLTFKIPKDIMEHAKQAIPGSKESYWSHKLYRGPEDQEVKVHYCKSKHTTERVAQYFIDQAVIGFDIEWKAEATKNAGIKKNVALIQVASESRIALFHIALFPGDSADALVAPTLKKIMENPEITKLGVAIKADCTRLRNFLQIDPKGIFELSHLFKLVKYSPSGDVKQINKKLVSLSTQVEEHLELPIFKGDVRGSDWSQPQPLSLEQINCKSLTLEQL
jgi:hypothetical protein